MGRRRSTESVAGKSIKIDTSAELQMPSAQGSTGVRVKDALEMADAIAQSSTYRDCFITHLYSHVVAREDACRANEARAQYAKNGEDIVSLLKWVFSDERFLSRARGN